MAKLPSFDWHSYFYDEFPEALRIFSKDRSPEHHCEHCRAPKGRRVLIAPITITRELPAEFRFSWYALTLLDQGIYTHFNSSSSQWVAATGGYPLPVARAGLGCMWVVTPGMLLASRDNSGDWGNFVNFYLGEMQANLETACGVKPIELIEAIASDRDFGKKSAEVFENELMCRARKLFRKV